MTKTIMHPVYGAITLDENIWTGKKTLAINGKLLRKAKRNIYILGEGESAIPITLKGSTLTGATLKIREDTVPILPKPTALESILSFLPLLLIIVWSNNLLLCSIIPVVGGAIGGAIGGVGAVASLCLIREKPVGKQVLMGLLITLICFAVCAALGFCIVAAMMAQSL